MARPWIARTVCTIFLPLVLVANAVADPPAINNISPLGIQRGTTTEVTINGANLAGNPRFLAPFAVAVEPGAPANADPANWKLKIQVGAQVPVGVYTIRVRTDEGLSNPFLFAVGQVPTVAEKEGNDTPEAAQTIASPCVVEGSCAGNDVDHYRFPGKKGQRIVVDAQCSRIGSTVDPQIRLTTANRVFVESADDSPGLLTDARLVASLPEDGDYVVEISDSKYQGGGRPVYRLLIGSVPVVAEVYPIGGRRGETVGFEFRGGTLDDPRVAAVKLSASPLINQSPLGATIQAMGLAGTSDPLLDAETLTPVELGDLPELREPDAADAPAVHAAIPVALNGRIDPAGDEDRFVLAVTPGQALHIRVDASELGSALDGTLQILDPKGAVLATAEDTVIPPVAPKGQKKKVAGVITPDPSLNFTVPANVHEITLVLRDLIGRGGIGFPYRIIIEPLKPGFQLLLNDAQISIPKGGTSVLGVNLLREGYNGPVTLSVANPPAGLTFRPGTVPEGQALGSFSISVAADAAFDLADLNVIGTGQAAGGPIVETGSKQVVFALQATIPTNSVTFNALAAATSLPRSVTLDTATVPIEVVHGFGAPIPIKAQRASTGGEGALAITALPMPPGLAVPAATIAEKATEGAATINAAPEAPLTTMTVALSAKGNIGGKDQTLGVPAVTVTVVRPAALELAAPAAEIKSGTTFELKGKVVRKGPFKEPVKLTLNALPAGLKAEAVTLAPDASDFTLKIIADPAAAAATANANLAMAFQINKKDYVTPPTPLAIKVVK